MNRNIITVMLLTAALANGACQSDTTTSNQTFTVHSEIMGACDADDAPEITPASNITVGTQSVYAFYQDAEFILQYGGKVFIERGGKQQEPIPAKVYQCEPGVWKAEMAGGQYIKVFTKSGNTNAYYDDEYKSYVKN